MPNYIEHLADNHDIIIISEHWLWPFELHKMKSIHPHMIGAATADCRLSPECNLIRGCGGIGIIWNKSLNPSDDFQSCLHTLEDLINNNDGPIVIAEDFNSHVGPEGGAKAPGNQNIHGRLLLEMVQNNDLFFPSLNSISSGPAYTFFRGETLSITDYIITDARHAHLTIQCQTYDHHPLNFSDHLPLSLTLSIMSNSNSTLSTSRSKPRLNWHAASADGSAEAYAKCVDEIVRPYLCRT